MRGWLRSRDRREAAAFESFVADSESDAELRRQAEAYYPNQILGAIADLRAEMVAAKVIAPSDRKSQRGSTPSRSGSAK